MLTRIYGEIVFQCDCCDKTLDTDTKDFDEALSKMRSEEWKCRKSGKDWLHYCPDCNGE